MITIILQIEWFGQCRNILRLDAAYYVSNGNLQRPQTVLVVDRQIIMFRNPD